MTSAALTELPERQRQRAFDRYQMLRPHLEQGVSLASVAVEVGLPLRTAQDWVSRYRRFGLAGLTRAARADQGALLQTSATLHDGGNRRFGWLVRPLRVRAAG